ASLKKKYPSVPSSRIIRARIPNGLLEADSMMADQSLVTNPESCNTAATMRISGSCVRMTDSGFSSDKLQLRAVAQLLWRTADVPARIPWRLKCYETTAALAVCQMVLEFAIPHFSPTDRSSVTGRQTQ